jgi:alpha-amylase/alpha-mannosidase (GH57 family)
MMAGYSILGEATFHNSDRGVAGISTWHDEVRDVKAWQDEDGDRIARNWRYQRK